METRFYEAQGLDLPLIAQSLVREYQAKGYETHSFGNAEQVNVQLRKESTLRAITGFNKALGIVLERTHNGLLLKVGAQDWLDQAGVGAVGLIVHPLLVTAAAGAITQHNVVHDILNDVDSLIHQQQPAAHAATPPSGY